MGRGFWGTIITQKKPFINSMQSYTGRLKITQATLDFTRRGNPSEKKVVVQCTVKKVNTFSLSVLVPDEIESQHLDLEVEEVDDIEISVIGSYSVCLTGYFRESHDRGTITGDNNSDTLGEDIEVSEYKELNNNDSEDDYDRKDSFIDDNDYSKSFSPSPKKKKKSPGSKKRNCNKSPSSDIESSKSIAESSPSMEKFIKKKFKADRKVQLTPKFPDF